MLKIDTFLLVANFFSGKIYRGSFANQNGFSALLKKITEMRNIWIGCMNYIFGKTFKKIFAHPLVNNQTIEISLDQLELFFKKINATPKWIYLKKW